MATTPFQDETVQGMTCPRVYTTGQVARICGVAARTVVMWTDKKKCLPFYFVPGTRDRRITRDALVAFLKERGMWEAIPAVSRKLVGLE